MEISKRLMNLKLSAKLTYGQMSGISKDRIGRICRGQARVFYDEVMWLSEVFNMTIMRTSAPVHEFTDKHVISQQRTKRNGVWHIFTESKA